MALSCRAGFIALMVASFGCADHSTRSIGVLRDTLVINSTEWTPLAFQLLDRSGARARDANVRLELQGALRVALRTDGKVNCQEDGVATIVIRVDTLSARQPIRCHLIHRFSPGAAVRLVAGGPPVPFAVQGYDVDNRALPEMRITVRVADTTIIALRDGLVYGLRPGVSDIRVRSHGQEGGSVYFVEKARLNDRPR